jgi:hypothetical protein
MPQIGQSLGATIPAIGTAGTTYATNINDTLTALVDACEAGVATSVGLTVDSNVDFDGNGITDASHIGLVNQASQSTTAGHAYIYNNEWYLNDGLGNDIRMTLNGALDASSVGGIGGDYGGGNPAAVSFNDANSKYSFTTDPSVFATLEAGPVRHIAATSGNALTVKAPDSLAGAYTVTWPTAVPGSTSLVMMSSAGVLSTSLTPSITSLTASGAISGATMTITAADVYRGEATDLVHALNCYSADATLAQDANGRWEWQATSGSYVYIPINLRTGDRLKSVVFRVVGHATGTMTCGITRKTVNEDPCTSTAIWTADTSTASATAQTVTLTGSVHTVSSTYSYNAYVYFPVTNFSGMKFLQLQVITDRTA